MILVNIDILGCPNLTAPAFGTIDAPEGWVTGATVLFTCEPYAVINGPSVRTCLTNNTWSGSKDPVCGQYLQI